MISQNSLLNNQAVELFKTGHELKSIRLLKKVLKNDPNFYEARFNLGWIFNHLGIRYNSEKHYRQAIKYFPENSDYHYNLSIVLFATGRIQSAIGSLSAAIKINEANPAYWYLLGHCYYKNSQFIQAIACYQKTYKTNPEYEMVAACIYNAKRKICDWSELKELNNQLDRSHTEDPWTSLIRTENPQTNFQAAVRYSKILLNKIDKNLPAFAYHPRPKKRLRIGYVSYNFGDHPVGYMASSVLKHHNKADFEVYTYLCGPKDGSYYENITKTNSYRFTDIASFSHIQSARLINNDKVDILVDLSGYTEGHRLEIFAYRPAPIQITWAGLLGTLGNNFIDYMIVDKIVCRSGDLKYFTEKLLYLPGCFYLTKDSIQVRGKKFTRKNFRLPKDKFVYGVFLQMYKIRPEIFSTWMNILNRSPNSVLWLWNQHEDGKNNLINAARKHRINPERLFFAPTLNSDDYFSRLELADLALDTPVYGGGATTYLSLFRGVPVITIMGKKLASRLSASILHKAELAGLVVNNLADYENLAVNLSQNPQRLKVFKEKLTPAYLKNTLLNTPEVIFDLEKLYQTVWEKYIHDHK